MYKDDTSKTRGTMHHYASAIGVLHCKCYEDQAIVSWAVKRPLILIYANRLSQATHYPGPATT
jgi:hypothetical protein